MIRDYLEVFREILRNPRWRDDFDLVVRAIFNNIRNFLTGKPCSALNGMATQQLGWDIAVRMTQLYFDDTFIGASVGLESAYLGSLNFDAETRFHSMQRSKCLLYFLHGTKMLPPSTWFCVRIEMHTLCSL